ncbi:MAG: HigA family addiction module antitoxin [Gammaproteobacteria bacterium]
MTRMHNPAHPGEVLRDGVFAGGEVTVTDAAKALGVTRVALSRVLNGRAAVSAEMAVRLGKWLNTGPEVWLNMQTQHDLWRAEHALRRQVKRIPTLAHAD